MVHIIVCFKHSLASAGKINVIFISIFLQFQNKDIDTVWGWLCAYYNCCSSHKKKKNCYASTKSICKLL